MPEITTGGYRRKASKVNMDHTDRTVKSYQVLDNELEHISTFNGWATLFYSLASASASVAAGLWCNIFVTDEPSTIAKKYGGMLQLIFWVLAAMFLFLAILSTLSRRAELARIRRDSGETVPPLWRELMVKFGFWNSYYGEEDGEAENIILN